MYDEVCRQVPNRQCFEYTKTVCSMTPVTQPKYVTWENQRLVKTEDRVETKCEMVKRCNFTREETTVLKTVPRQICENDTLTRELCQTVPVTEYKVNKYEHAKQ